jgi:hypothetical protein
MNRTWVGIFAFAGGVAAGLLFARWYAQNQVTGAVDTALKDFGLGGGKVQQVADSLVPIVVG